MVVPHGAETAGSGQAPARPHGHRAAGPAAGHRHPGGDRAPPPVAQQPRATLVYANALRNTTLHRLVRRKQTDDASRRRRSERTSFSACYLLRECVFALMSSKERKQKTKF